MPRPTPSPVFKLELDFYTSTPLALLESSFFSLKASTCPECPVRVCRERGGPDVRRELVITFFGRAGLAWCGATGFAGRCEGEAGLLRPTFLANFNQLP